MSKNFSGKQYQCVVAKQDLSAVALGSNTATNSMVSGTNLFMELDTVNPINYDGMIQQNATLKSGKRAITDEDMVQTYGYGQVTWDFDYLVKNEVVMQTLLSLVIGKGIDAAADPINITDAATKDEDLSHGLATSDNVANILLLAPTSPNTIVATDHRMHSAVLQNLTISMDMGTDSGRMHMSGQFMSGYKPVIEDSALTGSAAASNFEKGLFDCTTTTMGGHAVTMKSFSLTISNPANIVGFQGSSAETDGYVRGTEFEITGSASVKLDVLTHTFLTDWKGGAGSSQAIVVGDGADFSITIPAARYTGFTPDMADEGVFIDVPFKATLGADAASNLATIVMT
tara:strand:- start:812 stop:1840 length:1029 start_codon:yes stop_codon:yes gene_type:complete